MNEVIGFSLAVWKGTDRLGLTELLGELEEKGRIMAVLAGLRTRLPIPMQIHGVV